MLCNRLSVHECLDQEWLGIDSLFLSKNHKLCFENSDCKLLLFDNFANSSVSHGLCRRNAMTWTAKSRVRAESSSTAQLRVQDYSSRVTSQHNICPSTIARAEISLFRVLKRSPISQPHGSSTKLFRWEGRKQHDRTPTKIASESFPATVITPSAWPDWSKFQFVRLGTTRPRLEARRTATYQTRSERSNHLATRPVRKLKLGLKWQACCRLKFQSCMVCGSNFSWIKFQRTSETLHDAFNFSLKLLSLLSKQLA